MTVLVTHRMTFKEGSGYSENSDHELGLPTSQNYTHQLSQHWNKININKTW